MPSGPRLLLATLATGLACTWSPALANRASDAAHATAVHSNYFNAAAGLALDDGGLQLSNDGRELTAFTAAAAVTKIGVSVLEAFLGAGAGAIVDGIFGGSAVPIDLGALIDEAVQEIDRAVGERLAEAFNNERRALLDSLIVRVREYVRRADLLQSRAQVQFMLDAASELLAFFEDSGVVTNNAFQTTLALRLSLQLELLQLDELLGESAGVLAVVRESIKTQARTGKAALESWRASYLPATNGVRSLEFIPCTNSNRNRKCNKSSSERRTTVCMDISSPGLKSPPRFCGSLTCRSKHIRPKIRRRRTKRCTDEFELSFSREIRQHSRAVGLDQFRDLNEAAVFGEGFQGFLADLEKVQKFNFDAVALPEVGAADQAAVSAEEPAAEEEADA